jgi:hypothetical protein
VGDSEKSSNEAKRRDLLSRFWIMCYALFLGRENAQKEPNSGNRGPLAAGPQARLSGTCFREINPTFTNSS